MPELATSVIGTKNTKLTASASRPLKSKRREKHFFQRPPRHEWFKKECRVTPFSERDKSPIRLYCGSFCGADEKWSPPLWEVKPRDNDSRGTPRSKSSIEFVSANVNVSRCGSLVSTSSLSLPPTVAGTKEWLIRYAFADRKSQ